MAQLKGMIEALSLKVNNMMMWVRLLRTNLPQRSRQDRLATFVMRRAISKWPSQTRSAAFHAVLTFTEMKSASTKRPPVVSVD